MNKVRNIFVPFIILGLVGCAALPLPEPLDPQRAVIGISVTTRAPIKALTKKNKKVYFIKVDREEDLYTQVSYSESNYAKNGQVYLVNVEPGRYAAVGSSYMIRIGPPTQYTTFFSKELIKLTELLVPPGTIAFMGEYVVDTSTTPVWGVIKDPDDAQSQYSQMISRSPGYDYKGSLHEKHRDKQTEIRFLTKALEHFKGTGWTNIIQKRVEELKAEK